jgi:hypothetical protein
MTDSDSTHCPSFFLINIYREPSMQLGWSVLLFVMFQAVFHVCLIEGVLFQIVFFMVILNYRDIDHVLMS